jgi:hypothetical protein
MEKQHDFISPQANLSKDDAIKTSADRISWKIILQCVTNDEL